MNKNEILKIWHEYEGYKGHERDYNNGWDYANNVLYDMCKSGLSDCNKEVIAGRLLIIGRTYAATLERNKSPKEYNNDTYQLYSCVADLDVWKTITTELKGIKNTNKDEIIKAHYKVVEEIKKKGTNNKVSLVSKFMHFHWPSHFFIYDEQARRAITFLTPGRKTLSDNLKELEWKQGVVSGPYRGSWTS